MFGPMTRVLLLLCVLGCPAPTETPRVTTVCREAYAKCKLPTGPLGVCQPIECRAGETPPCFRCQGQH